MTTLYRPVLIESAEQAEALPEGTLATREDYYPVEKWMTDTDESRGVIWGDSADPMDSDDMVGWTALVPIEAEEERNIDPAVFVEIEARLALTQAAYAFAPGELKVRHVHRYVTPWAESPNPDDEAPALADCGDQA